MVNFSYKFRLYPTKEQQKLLNKMFGCSRFVWNYFLNVEKQHYLNNKEKEENGRIKNYLSYIDNAKTLTELKKQKEYEFLNEVITHSLQNSLKYLDIAYKAFFKKIRGFPSFKKRNEKQTFKISQGIKVDEINQILYIPKFQKQGINIIIHRKIKGRIVSGTISKTKSNKYFVSLNCENKEGFEKLPKNNNAVGIDLGIKSFAYCSNGWEIKNPHFSKQQEDKIKYNQRQLTKKQKKGKNRNKQRIVLARKYEKINNQKQDFLQKLSTKLINENQVICLEDLNVSGMMKNHKLAKSIEECSWSAFVSMLKYKAEWYGRELVFIDRFFPSTKTCFDCGYINQSLKLKDREWVCEECGVVHLRDWNASKNILKQGLNMSACGTQADNKQKLGEAPVCKRGRRAKKSSQKKRR